MRHPRTVFVLSMAVLFQIALSGCTAPGTPADIAPTRKWMQARETLTMIEHDLRVLYQANAIGPRDLIRMNVYIQSARVALEQAKLALPADSTALDMAVVAVSEALLRLQEVQVDDVRADPGGVSDSPEVDRVSEVPGSSI